MPPDTAAMDMLPAQNTPSLSTTNDAPVTAAEPPLSASTDNAAEKELDASGGLSEEGKTAPEADEATGADQQPDEALAAAPKAKGEIDPATRAGFARRDAQIAELRATVAQLQQTEARRSAERASKPQPRPSYDDFTDPQAYEDALVQWAREDGGRQAAERAAQDQAQRDQRAQAEAIVKSWNERVEAFEAENPDFRDVVGADDLKISPAMTSAIAQIENGPAVAYWLGRNRAEAERISVLDGIRAAVEIGKIADRVSRPERAPRRLPNPPPDRTERGSIVRKAPEEMSMEEYATANAARTAWNHRN